MVYSAGTFDAKRSKNDFENVCLIVDASQMFPFIWHEKPDIFVIRSAPFKLQAVTRPTPIKIFSW